MLWHDYENMGGIEGLRKLEKFFRDCSRLCEEKAEELERYADNGIDVIRKDVGEYYCPKCKEKLPGYWADSRFCWRCGKILYWNDNIKIQGSEVKKNI